jgi:hypothetical protein
VTDNHDPSSLDDLRRANPAIDHAVTTDEHAALIRRLYGVGAAVSWQAGGAHLSGEHGPELAAINIHLPTSPAEVTRDDLAAYDPAKLPTEPPSPDPDVIHADPSELPRQTGHKHRNRKNRPGRRH